MSIWTNIRKRGLRDVLNPRKWIIFIRYLRKLRNGASKPDGKKDLSEIYNGGNTEITSATLEEYTELWNPHELEQISVRMSNLECRTCLKAGTCHHCGCTSPDLFYDRTNWCSGQHWGAMVGERLWERHKETYQIEIDPDYMKEIRKHGKIVNYKD